MRSVAAGSPRQTELTFGRHTPCFPSGSMNIVDLLQSGYGSGLARLARASLHMDAPELDVEARDAVRLALEQLFKRDTPALRKMLALMAAQLRSLPPRKRPVGVDMLIDLVHAGCLARTDRLDASRAIVEGWREMLRPILVARWEKARLLECTGRLEDLAHAGLLREEAYELEVSFDIIAGDVVRSTPPKKRALVMLVDDDEDIRAALGILLEGNGYDVIGAENGACAIGMLERGVKPSLILLDLMMPVMNGWDFHKWQQQQEASPPTIVFTAAGVTPGALGALPIISKSVHPDALLSVVERAVAPVAASAP